MSKRIISAQDNFEFKTVEIAAGTVHFIYVASMAVRNTDKAIKILDVCACSQMYSASRKQNFCMFSNISASRKQSAQHLCRET